MNKMTSFVVAALALAACGDDKKAPDAFQHTDTPPGDTINIPPPPTPGAQIDRMGRPAINTALDHVFDVSSTAAGSAKDAYNQDSAKGTWPATYVNEFAHNLAILDALDDNGTTSVCGNQALYNGVAAGGGSAAACPGSACSYNTLAAVLADDQLYVDTSKGDCKFFLAVEFGVVTTLGNTTCGGRAPDYDVIDTVYTAVSAGVAGFDSMFNPAFGDNVPAHTDYLGHCLTTTSQKCTGENDASCPSGETCVLDFPFLGPPHNP
jgi:hypothetical protein